MFVGVQQTRFIFLSALLALAVGATIIAASATLGAIQDVHRHEVLKSQGDIHLIQPWMTIPYIAHVYQIPEPMLYRPLRLKSDQTVRHSTLQAIAIYKKQPVEKVIHKVQDTILVYRRSHPFKPGKPGQPDKPTKSDPIPTQVRGEIAIY